MKRKILIVVFVLIIILSGVLVFLSNHCAYEKISVELPDYLKTTEVSFEREMYYVEDLKVEYGGCLAVLKDTSRELMSAVSMREQGELFRRDETYKGGEPKVIILPKDKKFTVKEIFVSRPAKYIKNGSDVYYLVLEDSEGLLSTVAYQEFRPYKIGEKFIFPAIYLDDKEIGKIVSNREGNNFNGGEEFDLELPSLPEPRKFEYEIEVNQAENCNQKPFDQEWLLDDELHLKILTNIGTGGDTITGKRLSVNEDGFIDIDLTKESCTESCLENLSFKCLEINLKVIDKKDYLLRGNFYSFLDGASFSKKYGTELTRDFISGRKYLIVKSE